MNDAAASPLKASIFLLAYKMEHTLIEALQSAVAQTIPCEIIVSDDASGDRSFELAGRFADEYRGLHRLIVRRNERNQGLCAHINTLAQIATGNIFVFLAGDDVSYPNRVQRLLEELERHPNAYAIGSYVDEIDEHGRITKKGVRGMASLMTQRDFLHCGKFATLLGASMALRRELLVGMPPLQGMVEDNMLTLRASLFGPVLCLKESLLQYRVHGGNLGSWVYSRERNARRQRYERTIAMYRQIADDHERCLEALAQLAPQKRRIGERIVSMYRLEAEGREAVLNLPKRKWLGSIVRGVLHPGLRRKSAERAFKLVVPRRWMGL